ncbi:hypothetical protein ACSBR1_008607 [Camellia fascicularis]
MLLSLQRSMDAITNKVAAIHEALAKLECPSEASASHPPPMDYLVLDPSLPVEELYEPNLQEDLRVPTQPMGGLFPMDIGEIDQAMLRISKLEKIFEKSQGIDSILDIENGYIDIVVKLSK